MYGDVYSIYGDVYSIFAFFMYKFIEIQKFDMISIENSLFWRFFLSTEWTEKLNIYFIRNRKAKVTLTLICHETRTIKKTKLFK